MTSYKTKSALADKENFEELMKKQKQKLEDPIGFAVQERKDQGSYLSVTSLSIFK